ncbi:ArnT family glycosyltransferase [Limisalsivibrio acetivorans]|uniref:ArnT family glycosyltransferase n=1 Tax=Limisalsivibrio acetivorans TaxID=1304888 RepID=UPI0003B720BF|nr:glycosyltransferase family 39 protein [Limisalsivibrio acetivorans]
MNRVSYAPLFMAGWFLLIIMPNYFIPLFETTDARYAEIAREMFVSGNLLEPHFNGIKHFHKPPLTYWMTSLGYLLFGINGFGARFFGAFAALVTLMYTYRTARLLGDEKTGGNAVLILASLALFIIVSRVVSTDIYLTMFTAIAYYHIFCRLEGVRNKLDSLKLGVILGLGFLTKGPLILLFTIIPFILSIPFSKNHRRAFSLREWGITAVLFLFIGLPWYIAVILKNPGLLDYFIGTQTIDRVATDKFKRMEPWWYFLQIFMLLAGPYSLYITSAMIRRRGIRQATTITFYILFPFIVFSLSMSKLPTYILPLFPLFAILFAGEIPRITNRWGLSAGHAYLLLFAFFPALAGSFISFTEPYRIQMYAASAFCLLVWFVTVFVMKRGLIAASALVLIISINSVYLVTPLIGPHMKGYRLMAEASKNIAPELDMLCYHCFLPSLSFYRNEIVPAAISKTRETQFQDEEEYSEYYIDENSELKEWLSSRERLFMVTKPKNRKYFEWWFGYECSVAFEHDRQHLFLCERD